MAWAAPWPGEQQRHCRQRDGVKHLDGRPVAMGRTVVGRRLQGGVKKVSSLPWGVLSVYTMIGGSEQRVKLKLGQG